MDTISFSIMTDLEHRDGVVVMMRRLYEEDRGEFDVDYSKFASGIEHLIASPTAGQIVLFWERRDLKGYALLVPYWSNEFGGTLLFVDELFVVPECRSQGIGSTFFRYLERARPYNPVAFGLGVNPNNSRARRLYESLGFTELRIATLMRRMSLAPDTCIQ